MNLKEFAEKEMDLLGMEIDDPMRKNILEIIEVFSSQGHSGFSAGYIVQILEKLLRYEPLTPLTGEDSEWGDVSQYGVEPYYQNKRYSSLFKNSDGTCYDISGKIFYTWEKFEDTGEEYQSYFTNSKSNVPVTFPYIPKKEYVEWVEDVN
jgi:hypothetical protein